MLASLARYFDSHAELFHRGVTLFDGDDFREQTEALRAEVAEMRGRTKAIEKDGEKRHTHVSQV